MKFVLILFITEIVFDSIFGEDIYSEDIPNENHVHFELFGIPIRSKRACSKRNTKLIRITGKSGREKTNSLIENAPCTASIPCSMPMSSDPISSVIPNSTPIPTRVQPVPIMYVPTYQSPPIQPSPMVIMSPPSQPIIMQTPIGGSSEGLAQNIPDLNANSANLGGVFPNLANGDGLNLQDANLDNILPNSNTVQNTNFRNYPIVFLPNLLKERQTIQSSQPTQQFVIVQPSPYLM